MLPRRDSLKGTLPTNTDRDESCACANEERDENGIKAIQQGEDKADLAVAGEIHAHVLLADDLVVESLREIRW